LINKNFRLNVCVFLFVLFSGVLSRPLLVLADEKEVKPQTGQAPAPLNLQALPENQRNAILEIEKNKQKLNQLVKERNELIAKQAPPGQVQAKAKEIDDVRMNAMKLIQNAFPQTRMPQPAMPPPGSQLSPAQKQELEALIEKRKKMVANGATSKDVQGITDEIQKIYYSGMKPPPPFPPLPPGAVPPANPSQVKLSEKKTA